MAYTMVSQPSSPTTLLSQSSTLVDFPLSFQPPNTAALLSLTPELLLQIISHLPTASYHPLTRTSHGLRLFFKSNSAHICNTQILHHFPLESRLLKSTMRDGWLVPTHPSIYTSLSSTSLPKTEDLLVLSEPGPHYLRFLQEYSKDILIRAEMTILSSHLTQPPINNLSIEEEAEAEAEKAEADSYSSLSTSEKSPLDNLKAIHQQAERDFTFMLSTYCIRPYTTRLNLAPPNPSNPQPPPPTIKTTTTPPPTRRPVFGELPPPIHPPVTSHNSTHAALLWYFGSAGIKSCPPSNNLRLGLHTASPPITKHGILGLWQRVKILVQKRNHRTTITKIEHIATSSSSSSFSSSAEKVKQRMRGLKIKALGLGQRWGRGLLAAGRGGCARYGVRRLG